MHRHSLTSFPNGSFGGNLYLFVCPHLNLSNALARHFDSIARSSNVFGSSMRWRASKMRRSRSLRRQCTDERFPWRGHFRPVRRRWLPARTLIDEVILPFPEFSFVAEPLPFSRCVSTQAPIHVYDFLILHAEVVEIALTCSGAIGIVESGDLGLAEQA